MFFQVFLDFGVAGSVKSMPSGYSLDAVFNAASNELSDRNLSKIIGRHVDWESSLDAKLNFTCNEYPLDMLLTDLAIPKTRNTWKT